jgi:hypothetical protein
VVVALEGQAVAHGLGEHHRRMSATPRLITD